MVGRAQGNGIDCLDQSLNAGTYWVTISGGSINLPDDQIYGMLIVLSTTTRLFIEYYYHHIYINSYVNNTWQGWRKTLMEKDLGMITISINTGLTCYKIGKIVLADIEKEITLVDGWNILSTFVPEAINRTFGVCGTSDGVTFGMISISGTSLGIEFPNMAAGKTITVRGSITYFTK